MTKTLRKVPFDFYYRYTCETPEGDKVFNTLISSTNVPKRLLQDIAL